MRPPLSTDTFDRPRDDRVSITSSSRELSLSEILILRSDVMIKILHRFSSSDCSWRISCIDFPFTSYHKIDSLNLRQNFLPQVRSIILKLTHFPISVSFPQSRFKILILVMDWISLSFEAIHIIKRSKIIITIFILVYHYVFILIRRGVKFIHWFIIIWSIVEMSSVSY